MKISWHWLGRHVDLSGLDPRELANRFTLSVAELEGIEEVGAGMESVIAGRIAAVRPHPEADKLRLVDVDLGDRSVTLVSGAPNCVPGMVTAVALPGARLPGGEVKTTEIRGVESRGMTCSEADLGLSDDNTGILALPADTPPGTPLSDLAPVHDWVIEIDNKSLTHRPDCWSHRGIAREIASLTGRPLKALELDLEFTRDEPVQIRVEDQDLCPRFTAVCYAGITVAASPLWLKTLLHRVEVRGISNVVDLTNFVMLDVGNPVHAYDARFIRDGEIVVRRGEDGEVLTTLDDQERRVESSDVIIADGARGVGLGGIMGGLNSEIVADTTEVVLESASFQASAIRRTSSRLALRTEASARFEKALDPAFAEHSSRLFGRMLLDLDPGARVTSAFIDVAAPLPAPTVIRTSCSFIRRKLGDDVPDDRIVGILEGLEFQVAADGDALRVTVPTFRATKDIGIPEDLVEEVGRMVGYDNITPTPPLAPVQPPPRPQSRLVERRLRHFMVTGGGVEVMQYSFDSAPWAETIGYSLEGAVRLANPISADMPVMRRSLIPNLLSALRKNQTHRDEVLLFELGRVFHHPESEGAVPDQERHLGAVFSTTDADRPELAFRRVKWVMEQLLAINERGDYRLEIATESPDVPWITEGRLLAIRDRVAGDVVGWMGQVNPVLCAKARLRGGVGFFEIDLEPMIASPRKELTYRPLPRFPRITNDLSFIVAQGVNHQTVVDGILAVGGEFLVDTELVAVFRGAPIPEGHKSLSYRLTFGSDVRTLRDEEVRPAVDAVTARVGRDTGGYLREA
ncbi:MAG: phenylalanine--tRNA ligase subunit beta [Pseudomonadota bacterium]